MRARRPFRRLRRLEICGGGLGDEGAKELIWLTALQHLSLAQNPRLGDRASLFLSGLTRLQRLNLSGTQLTGNGILPLRALTVRPRGGVPSPDAPAQPDPLLGVEQARRLGAVESGLQKGCRERGWCSGCMLCAQDKTCYVHWSLFGMARDESWQIDNGPATLPLSQGWCMSSARSCPCSRAPISEGVFLVHGLHCRTWRR
jgi:hypothetical protein